MLRRAYYATVTYIDYELGRVLETLSDTGLDENTVIVVMGDHGKIPGGSVNILAIQSNTLSFSIGYLYYVSLLNSDVLLASWHVVIVVHTPHSLVIQEARLQHKCRLSQLYCQQIIKM